MACQRRLITACVLFMCLELARLWTQENPGCNGARADWLFVGLLVALVRFSLLLTPTGSADCKSLFWLAVGSHFELVAVLLWALRGAYLTYIGCLQPEAQTATSRCLALLLVGLNLLLAYTLVAAVVIASLRVTAANTLLVSSLVGTRASLGWSSSIKASAEALEKLLRLAQGDGPQQLQEIQPREPVPALAHDVELLDLVHVATPPEAAAHPGNL